MTEQDKNRLPFLIGLCVAGIFLYLNETSKGEATIILAIYFAAYVLYSKLEEISKNQIIQYRVNFNKKVFEYGHTEKTALPKYYLEQDNVVLPFPPYPGLMVRDWIEPQADSSTKDENEDIQEFLSGRIESVQWNNSAKRFECEVEPWHMTEQNIPGAVLSNLKKWGWKSAFYNLESEQLIKEWDDKQNSEERN